MAENKTSSSYNVYTALKSQKEQKLDPMACDAFYVAVFKSLRFHMSTLKTNRFQNDAFPKVSTFETVFESLRFHRRFQAFSVDARQKRIKKVRIFKQKRVSMDGFHTFSSPLPLFLAPAMSRSRLKYA